MMRRRLRLFAEVRDLQIVDRDDHDCGSVDDLELDGGPGRGLRVKAILVGPGAYASRLPRWAMPIVRLIAGNGIVAVPWVAVDHVASILRLSGTARSHGLDRCEARARRLLPGGSSADAA
jgi:hypothetical protein